MTTTIASRETPLWGIIALLCAFFEPSISSAQKTDRQDIYHTNLIWGGVELNLANPIRSGRAELLLDIPLLDFPFQSDAASTITKGSCGQCDPSALDYLKSYSYPSMYQSLRLSTDFYNVFHYAFKKGIGLLVRPERNPRMLLLLNVALTHVAVAVFDVLTPRLPLAITWSHEEFHRNMLTTHGVDSFNDTYRFDRSDRPLLVSKVKDEDLIQMKAKDNSAFVRAHAAGGESDLEMVTSLQKENFYGDLDLPHLAAYWYGTLSNVLYVRMCSSPNIDYFHYQSRFYSHEGDDISLRDYVGRDYTAWVYDLHRPDEPYEERGRHPSGVGIDRYIKQGDLTDEELDYLKRQGDLSLLNLISPFLIGINRVKVSKDGEAESWWANFSFRHHLTSFGSDTAFNLFLASSRLRWLFTWHNYSNRYLYMPGLEAHLIEYRAFSRIPKLFIGARLAVWKQPNKQLFSTTEMLTGALAGLRLSYCLRSWLIPYVEVEGKTAGWVAAIPYLERQLSLRLGIKTVIF